MKEVKDILIMHNDVNLTNGLIVVNNDVSTLVDGIDDIFDFFDEKVENAQLDKDNFEESVLLAMQQNDLYQAKTSKRTISIKVPSNTIKFDSDGFFENESKDIIDAFTTETISESFDLERFKNENRALYEQYLNKTKTISVDTAKLESVMPNIYNKYVTEIVSDKQPSLQIRRRRN